MALYNFKYENATCLQGNVDQNPLEKKKLATKNQMKAFEDYLNVKKGIEQERLREQNRIKDLVMAEELFTSEVASETEKKVYAESTQKENKQVDEQDEAERQVQQNVDEPLHFKNTEDGERFFDNSDKENDGLFRDDQGCECTWR